MTCRELTELLMDALSGELPEDTRLRFEAHLAGCAACVTYLDGYRTAVELAKRAFHQRPEAPVDDFPPELLEAILGARHGAH
jgi:anti-sigma factor RsiW